MSVTRAVLANALVLALLGVGVGLATAIPATRLVSGMLFGVAPLDPTTLAGVSLLLITVALIACLQPALMAARLDPARVLREE